MRLFFLSVCCFFYLWPVQAQDTLVNAQKIQALYADVQAKQADLAWQWEISRGKIQQKRLAISRIFARAYTLRWVSSLQKRYGGDKTPQQKAYLWLILKRSLLEATGYLEAEINKNKLLESEKKRLDEAARSFYFYTHLPVP